MRSIAGDVEEGCKKKENSITRADLQVKITGETGHMCMITCLVFLRATRASRTE
jgi:hypothetical protein